MLDVMRRVGELAEMLRSINGGYLTAYSPAFAVEFSTAEHVEIMTNFLMLGFDEPEKISQVDDIIDVSGMQENPAPSVFTNSLGMVCGFLIFGSKRGKYTGFSCLGRFLWMIFRCSILKKN